MTEQQVIKKARSEGRSLLTEIEAKELLKQAGVNVVDTKLATSREEAISISQQLGFPVALKIGKAKYPTCARMGCDCRIIEWYDAFYKNCLI